MSKLRVALIAPPWISIPPDGYGGIEAVVDGLLSGLREMNEVEVELFSVGETKIPGVKVHSLYKTGQYSHIHQPMYDALPIVIAHLQFALNIIEKDGGFDIIHDHNGFLGPQVLYWATQRPAIPPAIHTYHGPPFVDSHLLQGGQINNALMWDQLSGKSACYVVGISKALMGNVPKKYKSQTLKPVHNAVDVRQFNFAEKKKNYFITLARFSRDKGQHIAAQLCDQLGYALKMAGTVSSIGTQKDLLLELANPLSLYRSTADFQYYSDEILPLTVKNKNIVYVGNIGGEKKKTFIAQARALLFPIDWEEPFGMAVIEALASGTPVVAMNRGAMPEIIEHGVNGFLADTQEEFRSYMQRVDEIDPYVCRKSVEDKFSVQQMTAGYIERYHEAIERAA